MKSYSENMFHFLRARIASWITGVDTFVLLEDMFSALHDHQIRQAFRALDERRLDDADALMEDLKRKWGGCDHIELVRFATLRRMAE